jgi:hypothetical protein
MFLLMDQTTENLGLLIHEQERNKIIFVNATTNVCLCVCTQGEVRKQGSLFSYLLYKQVTVSNACVKYRHIRSPVFDVVAISVEAFITAVGQTVKALVVK